MVDKSAMMVERVVQILASEEKKDDLVCHKQLLLAIGSQMAEVVTLRNEAVTCVTDHVAHAQVDKLVLVQACV